MSLSPLHLSAFYGYTAFFTSVFGYVCFLLRNSFKVIALLSVPLVAFRTISRTKLIALYGQVAVPAALPVLLFGQQYEPAVIAGRHDAVGPPRLGKLLFREP